MNYCTLLGTNFLAVGLTLYDSIQRYHPGSQLYILAMDDRSYQILRQMNLPNATILSPQDLDPGPIAIAKTQMNFGQICWTCQPLLCKHILFTLNQDRVIYMDADCYFLNSPTAEIEKIEKAGISATLVPHAFPTRWTHLEASAGKYCVQFNFFRRDDRAKAVLEDWLQGCLQYNKEAPFHYIGQQSLSVWPEKFPGVQVIQNPMMGVAPWNAENFQADAVIAQHVIFYHFHDVSLINSKFFDIGTNFFIPTNIRKQIYRPYLLEVLKNKKKVESLQADAVSIKLKEDTSNLLHLLQNPTWIHIKSWLKFYYRCWKGEVVKI